MYQDEFDKLAMNAFAMKVIISLAELRDLRADCAAWQAQEVHDDG
jgi:hypothetical protein